MPLRISAELRRRIAEQAGWRCGYCLTPQGLSGARLEVDHILPKAAGGATEEENLWLACASCNRFKAARIQAKDPQTGQQIPLFNPREDHWSDHFAWSPQGIEIVGLTPCGRATIKALQLNHDAIVRARRRWVSVGWWPPLT